MAKRWQNRLDDPPQKDDSEEVLVLKSEYNPVWDYFSARELGDKVIGYWKEYAQRANTGQLTRQTIYQPFEAGSAYTGAVLREEYFSNWQVNRFAQDGTPLPMDHEHNYAPIPDISKTRILNSRLLVSKKRTRNLLDLTSLWKKTVIAKMDIDVLERDPDVVMASPKQLGPLDLGESDDDYESDDSTDRIDPNIFISMMAGYVPKTFTERNAE
ncbi:hypothetical protein FA15DRAFT_661187 [Coprinopsis marcescibilis]|uniref:Uncharacterized protein n=1 Tax=Coprinopsis marcescibilis TaxID=230819 RepID=A0A5C3KCT3_COPMA|nr:hypothetical protein FA15DRAFT_661187 [Coprinopsis marcescibilis]